MSVDLQTVKRVARLARIAVSEEDAERMTGDRQYEVRDALTSAARLLECRVFPPDPELGPGRIRRRRDNPVELVMLG